MRRIIPLLLIASITLCSGCAVFNRENTPALNLVEKHLVPAKNPARAASYPVVLPVAFAAGMLDMFLLHPASVLPQAWNDTDYAWKGMDWQNHYVTCSASVLPRTVLSGAPLVFAGSFIARSTLDISRRGGDPRLNEKSMKAPRRQGQGVASHP